MGRLRLAAGSLAAAIVLANAQAFIPVLFDIHLRPGGWSTLAVFAGSLLLGSIPVGIGWSLERRLSGLSRSMLTLAESFETGVVCAGRGDGIQQLALALEVFRRNSEHARIGEANLKAAVENMVEGIVLISADGKVALHNQRLLAIFGLPPMNAVGLPRAEFNAMLVNALNWPQSAQDYLQKQLAAVRADRQYRMFDVELPNNRVLRYSASVLPDGNVMSYIEDISEQRAAATSMIRLAHYDILTDLPNRTLFQERLAAALQATAQDSNTIATLLFCDLDRFKAVNDSYGHPVGDELLRQVARRMRAQIRTDDILARLGGDEFAVICLYQSDSGQGEALAKRLVSCLEQVFQIQGYECSVGISVGIASAPNHASSIDELMKRADLALYAAKQGGRNTHRIYDSAMSMLVSEYGGLAADLRRAIDQGGLDLHYQPQVDLRTRQIIGFEALARWEHPERGAISPGIFIPLAEEAGLIAPLGAWVMQQACSDAMSWDDNIMIAVNVAPQQLRVDGFVDLVRDVLARSGVTPSRLELEITESAPLHDDEAMLHILGQLAALGVRVSMDDFGTGNTGLRYLHKFRFDKLKIDQSFVRQLGDWREAELIVRAIIELSTTLGVKTVAEGIETERQAEILQSMSCVIGQGFLFGRPARLSVINALLSEQRMASFKHNSGDSGSLEPDEATKRCGDGHASCFAVPWLPSLDTPVRSSATNGSQTP